MKPIAFQIIGRIGNPTRGTLQSDCEKGCGWPVSTDAPLVPGLLWRWDGNVERPTISPSIDCQGGCGRHFTVIAGEAK